MVPAIDARAIARDTAQASPKPRTAPRHRLSGLRNFVDEPNPITKTAAGIVTGLTGYGSFSKLFSGIKIEKLIKTGLNLSNSSFSGIGAFEASAKIGGLAGPMLAGSPGSDGPRVSMRRSVHQDAIRYTLSGYHDDRN